MKKKAVRKVAAAVLGLALAFSVVIPSGEYSWHVPIVPEAAVAIDILNYEKNPYATEYSINNIAGMEKLAELVNSGISNFANRTVILQSDLKYERSVENNYTIIGKEYSRNSFIGTFKGLGHVISGVNINSDNEYVGLFGYTSGLIENICLENSSIVKRSPDDSSCEVGGIVGWLDVSKINKVVHGGITGCTIAPNTEVKHILEPEQSGVHGYVGGIVGTVSGFNTNPFVNSCINYGTITATGSGCIGGIVGRVKPTSNTESNNIGIAECCNYGLVRYNGASVSNVGGIIGENNFFCIVNCFDAGEMEVNVAAKISYVGGIAGRSKVDSVFDEGTNIVIENCYNIASVNQGTHYGSITCITGQASVMIGQSYWLKGTSESGVNIDDATGLYDISTVYEYTQAQMKAKSFVDELNQYSVSIGRGEVWEEDTKNVNQGYPVLKGIGCSENTGNSSGADDPSDAPDAVYEEPVDNGNAVANLFKDPDYKEQATDQTIQLYANGRTFKDLDGIKRNTNSKIIYTDIFPSYKYTISKKGVIVPSTGKVIVGITSTNQMPKLVKGKIVDKDAAKIAKAKIRHGQITVTSQKQAGTVYLWVVDTGIKNVSACCPVTVKMAPAGLNFLQQSYQTAPSAKKCTLINVNQGSTSKVYLKPLATDKKTFVDGCTYRAVVKEAQKAYISVQATSDPYCFKIKGVGKKAKGTTKAKITFTCLQNGKSASVTVAVK